MKPQTQVPAANDAESNIPWWRVGMVWLVVGGPLIVVIASLVTTGIAVYGAEEVLTRPASVVQSAAEAPTIPPPSTMTSIMAVPPRQTGAV